MRIRDWSSDVCSSDLKLGAGLGADFLDPAALLAEHDRALGGPRDEDPLVDFDRAVVAFLVRLGLDRAGIGQFGVELEVELFARHLGGEHAFGDVRSEEHTSELQSLLRSSCAVLCLKEKKT